MSDTPQGGVIHYDGGYSMAHGLGCWAVVLTDGRNATLLLARGNVPASQAQDAEREALVQALSAAEALGITHVYGDWIDGDVPIPPGITVEHIPSRRNKADDYTKDYPNWFEHERTKRGVKEEP